MSSSVDQITCLTPAAAAARAWFPACSISFSAEKCSQKFVRQNAPCAPSNARLEARLVVEVRLDDLGAVGGERLRGLLARVAGQRPDGEAAARVGEDRPRDPASLCAGGPDYGDRLRVSHSVLPFRRVQGRATTSAAIRSGPGRKASSSGGLYGIGEFGVVMRQASSRSPRPCSVTSASTSPAQPPVSGPSSTTAMPVRLLHRADDRLEVDRPQRAQVDHLGRDALLGEEVGRLERSRGRPSSR